MKKRGLAELEQIFKIKGRYSLPGIQIYNARDRKTKIPLEYQIRPFYAS